MTRELNFYTKTRDSLSIAGLSVRKLKFDYSAALGRILLPVAGECAEYMTYAAVILARGKQNFANLTAQAFFPLSAYTGIVWRETLAQAVFAAFKQHGKTAAEL